MLNVFNLLQWCFNCLIPVRSPHSGVNVVLIKWQSQTRGSVVADRINAPFEEVPGPARYPRSGAFSPSEG